MNIALLGASLLLSTLAWAGPSPRTEPLPVVKAEDFTPGRKWTWDYREEDGRLYSSETYEVMENQAGKVVIGMSTHFPDRAEWPMHHRIEADIHRCLAAYKNPSFRKAWSIKLMNWDKDHWADTGATSTLAFEEKFNCNPHAGASLEQKAVEYRNGSGGPLFLIRRKSGADASWFHLEGPNAAIQAEKEFTEGGRWLFRSQLRPPEEMLLF